MVQKYIENFTAPGEVVLDSFGGSGVTAIESLVLRRRAVHVDINPLANFITQQIAAAPVSLSDLSVAYHEVLDGCRNEIEAWRTQPDDYFDEVEAPHWHPGEVALPGNADVRYVDELFTRRQLFTLTLLLDRIMGVRDRVARELLRFCFSATLAKTNRTFISARNRAKTRGGSSIFSIYRYNVPKKPVELDPWEQFQERFRNLMECKKETNALIGGFYSEANCRIIQGSAVDLSRSIPSEGIDYVFTDPPYGGHIAYLDLSTMWNAWLGFPVTNRDREAEMIEGGDLQHGRDHYLSLLDASIAEIARVLRPKGWASIVFQHADGSLYAAILGAAQRYGLAFRNAVAQSLDVVWSMHKKKNQMRVLSGELILNFVKSSKSGRKRSEGGVPVLRDVVRTTASRRCQTDASATTEDIFNDVMIHMIETGALVSSPVTLDNVLELLPQEGFEFDPDSKRWHVKNGLAAPRRTLF